MLRRLVVPSREVKQPAVSVSAGCRYFLAVALLGATVAAVASDISPTAAAAGVSGPGIIVSDPADEQAFALFASTYELYPYGPGIDRALHAFTESKITECMRAAGYEYVEYPYMPTVPSGYSARALLPPLPSEAQVGAEGYDALLFLPDAFTTPGEIAQAEARSRQVQEANDAISAENPDWELRLFGGGGETPEQRGGCIVEAFTFVAERVGLTARDEYRAITPDLLAATDKELVIATAAQGEPLAAALEAWRGCMTERGFDYSSPLEAGAAFLVPVPGPDGSMIVTVGPESVPTGEEITVALADLACRAESDFRGALRDRLVANVSQFYDDNGASLAELRVTTDREGRSIVALAAELGVG